MGTYASITLNGFTIEEWKSTWHRWHFRESERVRELDKDSGEVIFQGYRSTAGTIRKRLALEGYTEKNWKMSLMTCEKPGLANWNRGEKAITKVS